MSILGQKSLWDDERPGQHKIGDGCKCIHCGRDGMELLFANPFPQCVPVSARPLEPTPADVSHETPRCTETRDFFELENAPFATSKSL